MLNTHYNYLFEFSWDYPQYPVKVCTYKCIVKMLNGMLFFATACIRHSNYPNYCSSREENCIVVTLFRVTTLLLSVTTLLLSETTLQLSVTTLHLSVTTLLLSVTTLLLSVPTLLFSVKMLLFS